MDRRQEKRVEKFLISAAPLSPKPFDFEVFQLSRMPVKDPSLWGLGLRVQDLGL